MGLHNQLHRIDPERPGASGDKGHQTRRLRQHRNIVCDELRVARSSDKESCCGSNRASQLAGKWNSSRR